MGGKNNYLNNQGRGQGERVVLWVKNQVQGGVKKLERGKKIAGEGVGKKKPVTKHDQMSLKQPESVSYIAIFNHRFFPWVFMLLTSYLLIVQPLLIEQKFHWLDYFTFDDGKFFCCVSCICC